MGTPIEKTGASLQQHQASIDEYAMYVVVGLRSGVHHVV
jgi:hypothetical protein